jgi:hypothetical protein
MASYPIGIYAPSPVSNGQVIDAGRDNAQDAEITAIQTGLKNGLAHAVTISTGGLTVSTGSVNIGGPSSLTTLQVNGGSTFTGPATFNGGINVTSFGAVVTLSSGAIVSTGIIRQNSLPMWNVSNSSLVAVAGNSTVGITFNSQDFVRGDIGHSTSANSSRVTINTTGVYHIDARGLVRTESNPVPRLMVVLNDTLPPLLSATGLVMSVNSSAYMIAVHGDVRVESTGYLTVQYVSGNNANSTIGSTAAFDALRFMGHFLG